MNPAICQQYLEEPEANAAHLRECEACSALFSRLEEQVASRPVAVPELPLASWEGARHRSWPVVGVGALVILAVSIGLFLAAGVRTLDAMVVQVAGSFPPLKLVLSMLRLPATAAGAAPILIGAFVIVNVILFALLRRPTRGVQR